MCHQAIMNYFKSSYPKSSSCNGLEKRQDGRWGVVTSNSQRWFLLVGQKWSPLPFCLLSPAQTSTAKDQKLWYRLVFYYDFGIDLAQESLSKSLLNITERPLVSTAVDLVAFNSLMNSNLCSIL